MMSLLRWLTASLILLQLVACAGTLPESGSVNALPPAVQPSSQTALPDRNAIIRTAREMLGAPYRYGGESQHGFDCSGLVVHAYRNAGIRVPRTSSEQYRQAQRIVLAELQPGDLLFFRVSPPKISHVGIYDSGSSFIHASSSGKRVEYASLEDPYWRAHLVGAGRF